MPPFVSSRVIPQQCGGSVNPTPQSGPYPGGSTGHFAFPDGKEGDNKTSLGFAWGAELMWSEPQHPSGCSWPSRLPGDAEVSRGRPRD